MDNALFERLMQEKEWIKAHYNDGAKHATVRNVKGTSSPPTMKVEVDLINDTSITLHFNIPLGYPNIAPKFMVRMTHSTCF